MIRTDVIIAGAGPTGLMLAIELARRGVQVRIIEARTERKPLSKALGVHARTLEAFAEIGIAEQAIARGRILDGATIFDNGEQVAEVRLDRLKTRYPFVLILPQWETEALLETCAETHGVTIDRGRSIASVQEIHDSVRIQLSDGETLEATYLVGCDGTHSTIRNALGISFDGADYPEQFVLADVALRWPFDASMARAFLSAAGIFAVFPLPQPGWARVTLDASHNDTPPEITAAYLEAAFAERAGADAQVDEVAWASCFEIHRRMAGTFRVGRCLLAGDAAHVHSPAGGQGMNLGLQDAFNLGWKLAAVVHGKASDTLLDSYEAERRPVAVKTLRGTDFATRVGMWQRPISRAVRGKVATWLSSFDRVQDRITQSIAELDVSYRGGPLVEDDTDRFRRGAFADGLVFARGPAAGDRAPDVKVGDTTLHAAMQGPGFRLLLLLSDPLDATELIGVAHAVSGLSEGAVTPLLVTAQPPVTAWRGATLLDPDGKVFHAYAAASSSAFLVRPDGYIGFRSDHPTAVRIMAYMERIMGANA